ncbi:extracellular solute-binding protein [Paenibacillus sp. LPE1-1-1.1]|uniref:extracellular solute-binding protein n=1 Tax=Paenibacillus sp. LPE1-1-1.1 TaxID=3135230 RepID=UPI00343E2AC6
MAKRSMKFATTLLAASILASCAGQTSDSGVTRDEASVPPDGRGSVVMTTGVGIGDVMSDFTEEKWENSVWLRAYLDELGIDMKAAWYAKGKEAITQKVSVAIASGKIPDLLAVNSEQLSSISKTNLYTDLTSVYETYATPLTKSILNEDDKRSLASATFDGKLIAIPGLNSAIDGASFMWIRQDWLDKLGLKVPETASALEEVMRAFEDRDPDGNGKADTIGLVLSKDFLNQGLAEAVGLFNAFDAYPKIWVKDESGNLAYGSVQPEVKDALAFLSRLYKEGIIETDFAAMDIPTAAELAANGEGGVVFGAMWNGMYPLQGTKDRFKDSDWRAYPIVSKDEQPAQPQIKLNVEQYYVVRRGYEHPEALIKLINFWTELNYGDAGQDRYNRFLGLPPAPGHHYTVAKVWKSNKNLQAYLDIKDALEKGVLSKLNAEEKGYYDNILKYSAGDDSFAQYEKVFGRTGSYAVMNDYVQRDLFKMDEFYGASTEAMRSRLLTIDQMISEYYTKVIMGTESIDQFDAFVANLGQIGLDEITKEVNVWKETDRAMFSK